MLKLTKQQLRIGKNRRIGSFWLARLKDVSMQMSYRLISLIVYIVKRWLKRSAIIGDDWNNHWHMRYRHVFWRTSWKVSMLLKLLNTHMVIWEKYLLCWMVAWIKQAQVCLMTLWIDRKKLLLQEVVDKSDSIKSGDYCENCLMR